MKRKVTKELGKNLKHIPEDSPIYEVNVILSDENLNNIKLGKLAVNMEDKWFVYEENLHLYLHRSWTGICICKLKLVEEPIPRIVSIQVNSDIDQFKSYGEKEDVDLIMKELNQIFNVELVLS